MTNENPSGFMIKEICQNVCGFFRCQEPLRAQGFDIVMEDKEVDGEHHVMRSGDIFAGFFVSGAETGDTIGIKAGGYDLPNIVVNDPGSFYLPIDNYQMYWSIACQFSTFKVITNKKINFKFVHIRLPHELRRYLAQNKFVFQISNEKKIYYGQGCASTVCVSYPDTNFHEIDFVL